jgi:hypothetical protein
MDAYFSPITEQDRIDAIADFGDKYTLLNHRLALCKKQPPDIICGDGGSIWIDNNHVARYWHKLEQYGITHVLCYGYDNKILHGPGISFTTIACNDENYLEGMVVAVETLSIWRNNECKILITSPTSVDLSAAVLIAYMIASSKSSLWLTIYYLIKDGTTPFSNMDKVNDLIVISHRKTVCHNAGISGDLCTIHNKYHHCIFY